MACVPYGVCADEISCLTVDCGTSERWNVVSLVDFLNEDRVAR